MRSNWLKLRRGACSGGVYNQVRYLFEPLAMKWSYVMTAQSWALAWRQRDNPDFTLSFATRIINPGRRRASSIQACTTCPRLRPHRASQSPPGREVRTPVRGVRSSPVADVSAHLHPSYSGAGVSSAAQCDRVPVVTASALHCHCMQARRPALCSTCPGRALLWISACADPAM